MSSSLVRLRLNLYALAEISSRESLPSRNIYETETFIPSTKVRGSLLSAIRRTICPYGPNKRCISCSDRGSCKFVQEVLPGFLTVTEALPRCECDHPIPVAHAPTTFFTCKVCIDKKKVFDGTRAALLDQNLTNAKFCETHSQNYFRVPYKGPICLNCLRPLTIPTVTMRPGIQIDNHIGSASEGQLYFTETISYNTNTLLQTDIIVSSVVADYIQQLVKDEEWLVQVGAGRGKGWGILHVDDVEMSQNIESVIDSLVPIVEPMLEDKQIIFFARTPIASIVSSTDGFQTLPHVQHVAGLKLVRGFGRTTTVSGWSLISNLQRPLITAAEPGSAFLYSPVASKPDPREIALLELTGIGDSIMKNTQLNQIIFWRGYT